MIYYYNKNQSLQSYTIQPALPLHSARGALYLQYMKCRTTICITLSALKYDICPVYGPLLQNTGVRFRFHVPYLRYLEFLMHCPRKVWRVIFCFLSPFLKQLALCEDHLCKMRGSISPSSYLIMAPYLIQWPFSQYSVGGRILPSWSLVKGPCLIQLPSLRNTGG